VKPKQYWNPMVPEPAVTDFKKSFDFYTKVPGFKVVHSRQNPDFACLDQESAQIYDRAVGGGRLEYPATGEVFADDSPYNNPLAIRALFTVLNHTQQSDKRKKLSIEEKQAQNVEIGKPKNDGLAWAETLRNL